MAIIPSAYWKFFWPLVLVGATGLGIRLYIDDVQHLVDFKFLSSGTYSKKLTEAGLTLVSDSTSDDVLKNILRQRMYPHYHSEYKYKANSAFNGSKEFKIEGEEYKTESNGEKKMFIFKEHEGNEAEELKESCKTALAGDFKEIFDNGAPKDPDYYRLREWCTEPKIRDVLSRHKLTLLKTEESNTEDDDKWKEVIGGGWFKNDQKNNQNFVSDLTVFLGTKSESGINSSSEVEESHIKFLKRKCKEVLEKPFKRKSFPAPKAFLDKLSESNKLKFPTVDEFQEAALFCTKPMSAKDYVEKAMQGEPRTTLPTNGNLQNDFCLDSSKTIDNYKSVKTNNPFDGKSFWCAVRILYDKHKTPETKK